MSPAQPKPHDRIDTSCRVRITAGQDMTYEEYSRVLFERAWEKKENANTR